jgi:hypothetical protein
VNTLHVALLHAQLSARCHYRLNDTNQTGRDHNTPSHDVVLHGSSITPTEVNSVELGRSIALFV